jgi:hypothetical protein
MFRFTYDHPALPQELISLLSKEQLKVGFVPGEVYKPQTEEQAQYMAASPWFVIEPSAMLEQATAAAPAAPAPLPTLEELKADGLTEEQAQKVLERLQPKEEKSKGKGK